MSNIREGVGENTILELIADLKKLIDGLTNSKDNPLVALQDAREAIEDLSYQEVELMGNPEKEDELKQIREQKKQLKDKMEEIIKDNDEALKAANSIDEVQDLLNEVEEENNNRFVDGSKIKQRIEDYKRQLADLAGKDIDILLKRLNSQIAVDKEELQKLKDRKGDLNPSEEFKQKAAEERKNELQDLIKNREAMMASGRMPDTPETRELLNQWHKEVNEIEQGNLSEDVIKNAAQKEMADLKQRIENRKAMMASGRQDSEESRKQLLEWEKKYKDLENGMNFSKEDQEKIDELEEKIKNNEEKAKDVEEHPEKYKDFETAETMAQKKMLQDKIDTLEDIDLIFFKDGKPVDRPDLDIDEDELRRTINNRTNDMIDKYYGNPQKAKEYKKNWKELKKHIKEEEFEYTDEEGNTHTGKYKTVEEYEGMKEKMDMMQLQDFKEKLEKVSKAEAGDTSIYPDTDEGKEQFEEDKFYVDTYNASYNRLKNTKANLITLGKYGEKVPYTKMQEKQPVRNVLRAAGNALKFVRNHTTAPINHFVGKFIVSPVYGLVAGSNRSVAGLYSNKASHRYVARREYFASQGDGYIKSRLKSIFKYKEGNKAVLSAGKREIEENAREVVEDKRLKEEALRKAEWSKANVDEKIATLQQDLANEKDITKQEELRQKINDLNEAKKMIEEQKAQAEAMKITTEKQNDAVDNKTHDIANKENVTRTITGVKLAAKAGLVMYGPKLSTWLANHKTIEHKDTIMVDTPQKTQQWIPATYKEVPDTSTTGGFHGTLQEMMSGNAGKDVTGYYSVYGGEVAGKSYKLTGSEKITAIFQGKDFKSGTGLSDAAGLTNPVLTDRRFAEAFLDSNGVLKQDVSMDKIVEALGANTDMSTLDQLYFSVGDKCWVRASDLIGTEQVVNATKKVVDVPGHMEEITTMVKVPKEVISHVPDPKVVKALARLGKAGRVAGGAMLIDDIYENVRKTDSKARKSKPEDRNYEDNGEFTGTKRGDQGKKPLFKKKDKDKDKDRDDDEGR